MTAKRKARGTLGRLEALEERQAAHAEEVRAANWAHIEAAEARLSPEDRAAWREAAAVFEKGAQPDMLERMARALAHLPEGVPIDHPAKEEAEAWDALDVPAGVPLRCPPEGRAAALVAYFEAAASWCDARACTVPLSPDVHRLARWGAALWRFEARLCEVLGRQA